MNEKLETRRLSAENELKNFLKVVRYDDLNLWSVKLSAGRAHRQLFRIVKQFKVRISLFFRFILSFMW